VIKGDIEVMEGVGSSYQSTGGDSCHLEEGVGASRDWTYHKPECLKSFIVDSVTAG
jgi:hypothetical protein